jgi:hypothetical protein
MFHEKRGVTIMLMLENTFCDYSVFSHPSTSTRQPYPPQSHPRIALLLRSSLLSTPSSSISCVYHLGAPTTPFDSPPTPTMLELIHLSCSAIVCHHPWGDSSVRVDPAGRGLATSHGGEAEAVVGHLLHSFLSLSLYLPPSLSLRMTSSLRCGGPASAAPSSGAMVEVGSDPGKPPWSSITSVGQHPGAADHP